MSLASMDFEYIRGLVHRRAAIVLEPEQEYLAESRLTALARGEGLGSLPQLVARLRAEPHSDLHRRVVEAMATHETSFFRDQHPFEALRNCVLPELMARRSAQRSLDIWSAACSSGQEPYSIAMLLRETPAAAWNVRLIASDLAAEMLARARAGVYNQLEVNRGLPAALLVRYFEKRGLSWAIKPEIRRIVEFRETNLAEPWPALPAMDVVFMRNVLIYFDTAMKKDVLRRLYRLLRPGGYLFLGTAETTLNLSDGFERAPFGKAVCYRRRGSRCSAEEAREAVISGGAKNQRSEGHRT